MAEIKYRRTPQLQLELIRLHIENGNTKQVKEVIEGKCSWQTLLNLLKNSKNLEKRTTVRNGILTQIARELPEIGFDDMVTAYNFFLKEMGTDIESQRLISKLDGRYKLISNIPDDILSFKSFRIRILSDTPFVPTFKCYMFLNSTQRTAVCDGFVFISNSKLIFFWTFQICKHDFGFRYPHRQKTRF